MKQTIKAINEKLNTLSDAYDLKKRFPDYFNKTSVLIFRTAVLLLFIMVGFDLYLNAQYSDNILYSVVIDCQEVGGCVNQFYYPKVINTYSLESFEYVYNPDLCARSLCDNKTLPYGFHYGRDDILSNNGALISIGLILLAVLFNHVLYMKRVKKW